MPFLRSISAFLYMGGVNELAQRKKLNNTHIRYMKLAAAILWTAILVYMSFPFDSNFVGVDIQYDFIFTVLILIALAITFVASNNTPMSGSKWEQIEDALGKLSLYIFFGQPILYSAYTWYRSIPVRTLYKFLLFHAAVIGLSMMLCGVEKLLKNWIRKKKD